YNALGQRVSKTGLRFVYDESGHLLGEYDPRGNLVQELVWLDDMPVASLRPDARGGRTVEVFHIHPDHLGTPRQITDSADRIVWRWDTADPFGNALADDNPDDGKGKKSRFEFNLRFPGQYFDGETGLHYNYFRDYEPGTGRYVQSDPIGLAGGMNLYAYVGGNPVSFTDPSGLVKWTGTFGGAAYIEGVGAGFFKFDLTSECKCGKIMRIKGYVSSVAAGLGMTATGSGGAYPFQTIAHARIRIWQTAASS
ncbi:MAG: RHS repeat-associated core domain-containing protein, partial [Thiobacillus sp.]